MVGMIGADEQRVYTTLFRTASSHHKWPTPPGVRTAEDLPVALAGELLEGGLDNHHVPHCPSESAQPAGSSGKTCNAPRPRCDIETTSGTELTRPSASFGIRLPQREKGPDLSRGPGVTAPGPRGTARLPPEWREPSEIAGRAPPLCSSAAALPTSPCSQVGRRRRVSRPSSAPLSLPWRPGCIPRTHQPAPRAGQSHLPGATTWSCTPAHGDHLLRLGRGSEGYAGARLYGKGGARKASAVYGSPVRGESGTTPQ